MKITVRPANDLTEEERRCIDDLDSQAFAGDDDDDDGYQWSTDHDWHILVEMDEQLASCLSIVERTCTVGGQPVRLGGIAGLATLPEWRGRGLAGAALQRAAAFMRDKLDAEFGLLLCRRDLVPYYRRFGWQLAEGPLTFAQPGGKVTYQEAAMVLPITGREWPPGMIDLCGLPW
jgi:GNAT superfamily N-acetyltransferase